MAYSDNSETKQWGGTRPGAGRKAKWRSPTSVMRLPEQFRDKITAYAELLDQGKTVELVVMDAGEQNGMKNPQPSD